MLFRCYDVLFGLYYKYGICDIIDIDLRRCVTDGENLRYAVLIYAFHVQTQ